MPRVHEAEPVESMGLVGGDVSLDFVNTASGRSKGSFQDKLRTYNDLVIWAERSGLGGAAWGARLRRLAAADPRQAGRVLEQARSLRELLFRVFSVDAPSPEDLEALGDAAAHAASMRRLRPVDEGFAFAWRKSDALEQVLWPVALAGAELLVSEERARVKECASDTCDWLFLDRSRNRSRRWCDMSDCGNRAKARRYQARHRHS